MVRWTPMLLLLGGCERDPTLIGFWEVLEWEVGEDVVVDAGTMEFNDDGKVICIFRYSYGGGGFSPVAQPEVQELETSAGESEDFIGSYHEKGETYSVSIGAIDGFGWGGEFGLTDWTGGSVRLHSGAAVPYGMEGSVEGGEMGFFLKR